MLDIVIATYNRFDSALKLANSLIDVADNKKVRILIVDSTQNQNKKKFSSDKIIHILSSYKNQPYQRYLGFLMSKAEYLLFLDDDMKLLDSTVFNVIYDFFNKKKGYEGINFAFKNVNSFLSSQPNGVLKRGNLFKYIVGILTGYPTAPNNKYIYCGFRGKRISDGGTIQFFSGGAFAVKRKYLYENLNFQLFDLYEQNLGKGEDGILGFSLSCTSKIAVPSSHYFIHIDQKNSSYTDNIINYSKRVMYSRLFLSCEYYRLKKRPIWFGYLRFHHYALGRIIGTLMSVLLHGNYKRIDYLKGYCTGWLKTFTFKFDKSLSRNEYWHNKAIYDMESYKN